MVRRGTRSSDGIRVVNKTFKPDIAVAARATMNILMHLALVGYYTSRDLFALLTTRMANLSIEYGNAPSSALGYALRSMVAISQENDHRAASELGHLALGLLDRYKDRGLEGKVLMYYANCVDSWFHHVRDVISLQQRGFEAAVEAGGLNDALNCLWGVVRNKLFGSTPLDDTLDECMKAIALSEKIHDQAFGKTLVMVKYSLRCYQGSVDSTRMLMESDYDEHEYIETQKALGFQAALAHYNIFKTWSLFLYGHCDLALHQAEKTAAICDTVADQPHIALHTLHHALLLLWRQEEDAPGDQHPLPAAFVKYRQNLCLWSEHCPENYHHYHLLIEAELARTQTREIDALRLYDAAITTAEKNEAHYIAAVASEAAARFWSSRGKTDFADLYLTRAHAAYIRWHARGKAKLLEMKYPQLFASVVRSELEHDLLDIESVMKATHAISREMEIHRLLATALRIMIENAGAQIGCLLREERGTWIPVAQGTIGDAGLELHSPIEPVERCMGMVSPALIRFVARTGERVVLDDAANEGPFMNDPHITRAQTRSLLCMPLLSRGSMVGILCLQNNLATQVFTTERVRFLEILVSQFAISLENARIYEALRASEQKFQAIFQQTFQFIGLLSSDGTVLEANQTALQFAGIKEDAVLGKPFWDTPWWTHSSEMQKRLRTAVREAANGHLMRFEATHVAPDDSVHYIDFSLKPITDSSGRVVQLIPERPRHHRTKAGRGRSEEAPGPS